MKKFLSLLITTLLISGCTSPTEVSAPGVVTSCDQIRLLEDADKSALILSIFRRKPSINSAPVGVDFGVLLFGEGTVG